MKRIISIMLCLACLLALPVAAAPSDPMAVKFQKFLDRCDSLYDGDVIKLVLTDAMKAFVPREDLEPMKIAAADFETELEKHIVLTDTVRNDIRSDERGLYDSTENKYAVKYPDGITDISDERQYRGYVKTGENTYDVYYQNAEREILDESPEVISQYKNPITGEVKFNGKVYVQDSDRYYCIKNWKDGGKKYTVEVDGGKMRFVSGEDYVADQQPAAFNDVSVTYELPKDDTVYLDNVAYFPDQTIVKVERITGVVQEIAEAMATVSSRYAPYSFTATLNGTPVQPGSKMKVHFVVPENFGADTVVMHLDAEGKLTELASMVKNIEGTSYLVTELEHFSIYLLVDKDAKPAEQTAPTTAPTTQPTTAPTTVEAQATTAATQATAAATNATTVATQATNAATKVTAPVSKPTSVTVVRPTVPATSETVADPTEETAVDPTAETTVAPTEEIAPTDEATVAPTEAPKPAKSNKTGGIIAAVIVVIALAGGGFAAWWFYFRKKGEPEVAEKTEQETEEKTEE